MADVRPRVPDNDGLLATLRWCGAQSNARTGLPVTVTNDTQPGPSEPARLPDRVERALFRIAPEALTNAIWHSDATKSVLYVSVAIGVARLTIKDDGIGFNAGHSGAPGRADCWCPPTAAEHAEAVDGRRHIESTAEEGTRVIVEVGR
jgi:signal transduction histidine kinase